MGSGVGVGSTISAGVGAGVGSAISEEGSGVSVGDAKGVDKFGESSVVETGVGAVAVALNTGFRFPWLLMEAVISMSTLVVSPSLIWNLMIMSILSEGTFRSLVLSSEYVAVASLTCKRIFE